MLSLITVKHISIMKHIVSLFVLSLLMNACVNKSSQDINTDTVVYEFVMASEVDWTYLNPARKDKAPMAGTLFGDRNGNEPTGYLLKPQNGLSSPPHIHNVSYRGLVISGLLHNDDPNAANMWMPSGSFWTQPKGEVHITSAMGDDALAYIEIDQGPYLVMPVEQHFDSGERPVNMDQSNIVWVDAKDIEWISQDKGASRVQVAFLWGDRTPGAMNGTLVKLPASYEGELINEGNILRSVIISGEVRHQTPNKTENRIMTPGSYFGVKGQAKHLLTSTKETIIYLRTNGTFHLK